MALILKRAFAPWETEVGTNGTTAMEMPTQVKAPRSNELGKQLQVNSPVPAGGEPQSPEQPERGQVQERRPHETAVPPTTEAERITWTAPPSSDRTALLTKIHLSPHLFQRGGGGGWGLGDPPVLCEKLLTV